MERRPRGTYSPPRFGPGRGEEAVLRGRAAAATAALVGGAARPGRRGAGVAWLVVVVADARGLSIGGIRRWRRGSAVVVGRRARRAPLMALGPAWPLAGVAGWRGRRGRWRAGEDEHVEEGSRLLCLSSRCSRTVRLGR